MGYSPPKGRSPTCYSPVRHSHETPKGPIPVRLACLIRAASVRSEPGSNSPSYLVSSPFRRTESFFSIVYSHPSRKTTRTHSLSILTSLTPFPIAEKLPAPLAASSPPRLSYPAAVPSARPVLFFCDFKEPYQRLVNTHPFAVRGARANLLHSNYLCQVQIQK